MLTNRMCRRIPFLILTHSIKKEIRQVERFFWHPILLTQCSLKPCNNTSIFVNVHKTNT